MRKLKSTLRATKCTRVKSVLYVRPGLELYIHVDMIQLRDSYFLPYDRHVGYT